MNDLLTDSYKIGTSGPKIEQRAKSAAVFACVRVCVIADSSLSAMTSEIVKCASCNVVINELLAFLANVLDYMDEESIHQLVTSSFSVENITRAKSLLFESLPSTKRMPVRRKEGKKRKSRDLDDIISVMKATNAEMFPIFVAKDLHMLPSVSFDHVDCTRLLKDISRLQTQISLLQEKIVTTDMFECLKLEVDKLKLASSTGNCPNQTNINNRRGAALNESFYDLNSGPMGLNYVPMKSMQISAEEVNYCSTPCPLTSSASIINTEKAVSFQCEELTAIANHTQLAVTTAAVASVSENVCETISNVQGGESASRTMLQPARSDPTHRTVISNAPVTTCAIDKVNVTALITKDNGQTADACVVKESRRQTTLNDRENHLIAKNCSEKQGNKNENSEWNVVRYKSGKQYKLIGQRGCAFTLPDGKFKAAEIKIPLFISNVSKETSEQDIISYIKNKTNEDVTLKMIQMKSSKKYNAYKVFVSKNKIDIFLKDDLWPDGITFRRFVRFLYKTKPMDRKVIVNK